MKLGEPKLKKIRPNESPVMQKSSEKQSELPLTYFGKSMTLGDFNGDRKNEVFVGAPGY
jgi:hypothetical protein